MIDSRTAGVLASDDLDQDIRDDLVTLERGTSRRLQGSRRGARFLWTGVLVGALLGAAASATLMPEADEMLARVAHAVGVDTADEAAETTERPAVARSEFIQIADATWPVSPPELSAAAVTADNPVTSPDHVDATSALKRAEGELVESPLQDVSEASAARGVEQEEDPQGAISDEFEPTDPPPTAIELGNPPALPTPDTTSPISAMASPEVNSPAPPARPMTRAEMKAFLDRADSRLRVGDIGGARRLLEYAGSGGSGEALLLLATTYDPAALAGWGARSVKPDTEVARALYERALELGVTGAQERLAALPSAE